MSKLPRPGAAHVFLLRNTGRGGVVVAGLLSLAAATPVTARQVSINEVRLTVLEHQAQTARDIQELQNLMARRALLHSIGHNEEELELWARHHQIRWAQNSGCWIGDDYRNYYVTVNYAMQKAGLKAVHAGNPAVADDFAQNRYVGSTVLHLLTTPLIEVAEDGQSAKGFWYTPGVILSSPDGHKAEAMNMWERYGVDFIREDGQWRFLHIEVITDFAWPFGGTLAGEAEKSGSESAKGPGPGAEGMTIPGPSIPAAMGETYSATRVPRITPRLPEPYKTLSQTFQYADCKQAAK